MSGSANNGTYGPPNSPWGPGPGWNQPGWDPSRAWHAAKPFWIGATVLGFIFWWPVGLALLVAGLWGKRMGYAGCGWNGGWQRGAWQGPRPPWAGGWKSFWCGSGGGGSQTRAWQQPSGNRAFDEYRAETLRRLEDEQKEFTDFLDRLRVAKDKAEFDQFMSERRSRPPAPPAESSPPIA